MKYPAQMEKAVQDVIEAQLKRDKPESYSYETDDQGPPQVWTNPLKAQLAPIVYRMGISLPLFFVQAESMM